MKELPIIQKTYDLIQWYVPILSRLPKTHKFTLGDRIISNLYDIFFPRCLALPSNALPEAPPPSPQQAAEPPNPHAMAEPRHER